MTTAINPNPPLTFFEEIQAGCNELVHVITELFFTIIDWVVSFFYSPLVEMPQHVVEHLDANLALKTQLLQDIFQYLPLSKVAQLSKEWNAFAKNLHYERRMYKLEQDEDLHTIVRIFKHVSPGQTLQYYHDELWRHLCDVRAQGDVSKSDNYFKAHPPVRDFHQFNLQALHAACSIYLFTQVAADVPEAAAYLKGIKGVEEIQKARLIRNWYLDHSNAVCNLQKLSLSFDPLIFLYMQPGVDLTTPLEIVFLSGLKEMACGYWMMSKQMARFLKAVERITWHSFRAESSFSSICALVNLESLYVSSNGKCITREICQLNKLKSLQIIDNDTENTGGCSSLDLLDGPPLLEHFSINNCGNKFPAALCNMQQLQLLSLGRCTFASLPREITQMTSLILLIVDYEGDRLTVPKEITVMNFSLFLRFAADPQNRVYFAGEVLDVDGPCGGFNLQWAFSSGCLAGRSAAR